MDILSFIFPKKCLSCSEPLPGGIASALCPVCAARFESECRAHCPICNMAHTQCRCVLDADRANISTSPITYNKIATITMRRGSVNPRLVLHLAEYTSAKTSVADRLVLSAKYGHDRPRDKFIAERFKALLELHQALPDDKSEIIITNVPRRRAAIVEYGCDQAEDLAQSTARILGVAYRYTLTNTGKAEQKLLTREGRLNNARTSFCLRGSNQIMRGKIVVLIDDVVTTGASMAACADLLMEAGAAKVICMSVVRNYKKD